MQSRSDIPKRDASSQRSNTRPASLNRNDGSLLNVRMTAPRSTATSRRVSICWRRSFAFAGPDAGFTLARRRAGLGSWSEVRRRRTSRTVDGASPDACATSRNEAEGLLATNSLARRRPSALLTGRTRPSRPTRVLDRRLCSTDRSRIPPTVLGARPVIDATHRSDHCG